MSNRVQQVDGVWVTPPGYEALWDWFGLSYAGWITLPRVMCHEMPDEWQAKMAALMQEWDDTWQNVPDEYALNTCVSVKKGNRYTKMPSILCNYRHPNSKEIRSWMAANPQNVRL